MPTHPPTAFPRICVFCGAASGNNPAFALAARELGKLLAHQHTELVYGGGNVGLMGEVASSILAHGGKAIGVITKLLETRELAHKGVQRLDVVETMHERKMLMATLADAFIALPGGLGTLDELFEILAWAQLGIHRKPVGLLNTQGFFDPIVQLITHVRDTGFLRLDTQRSIVVRDNAADLLRAMQELANTREQTDKQPDLLAPYPRPCSPANTSIS